MVELAALPRGMSISTIASRFGKTYAATQKWVKWFKYPFKDMRVENCARIGRGRRILKNVNWSMTNRQIADKFNVTRAAAHIARIRAGKPKVNGRKRK